MHRLYSINIISCARCDATCMLSYSGIVQFAPLLASRARPFDQLPPHRASATEPGDRGDRGDWDDSLVAGLNIRPTGASARPIRKVRIWKFEGLTRADLRREKVILNSDFRFLAGNNLYNAGDARQVHGMPQSGVGRGGGVFERNRPFPLGAFGSWGLQGRGSLGRPTAVDFRASESRVSGSQGSDRATKRRGILVVAGERGAGKRLEDDP